MIGNLSGVYGPPATAVTYTLIGTWEAVMRVQLRLVATRTARLHRLLRALSHVAPFLCTHGYHQQKDQLCKCRQAL